MPPALAGAQGSHPDSGAGPACAPAAPTLTGQDWTLRPLVWGWAGWRLGRGKSPGMQRFESPVLFPCGLINTRRGWLVTHELRCRGLQVLLAWGEPAIKHWKGEGKS